GPYDKTTFATIEALDGLVGQVRAAAERAYGKRFVLAVVSDHGHLRTDRAVHVNAALERAGVIDVDAKGTITAWRAYAWAAGGSAAVVLKEPNDDTTRAKAKAALQQLGADSGGAPPPILRHADQ